MLLYYVHTVRCILFYDTEHTVHIYVIMSFNCATCHLLFLLYFCLCIMYYVCVFCNVQTKSKKTVPLIHLAPFQWKNIFDVKVRRSVLKKILITIHFFLFRSESVPLPFRSLSNSVPLPFQIRSHFRPNSSSLKVNNYGITMNF